MTNLLQTIPSPMKIRDELETMVLNDLLGPVGGPEEEIDEPSVRDRYLVGMLAPKRQELTPEEFDELPQGGAGSVEDGPTDYSAPVAKTMFPSSFGMTFCGDLEAKELQVAAHWGHYHRDRSATLTTPKGDKKLIWKRGPRGGVSEPIPLVVGRLKWTPDPEFPEVQGLLRKRERFWTITLFLVNGQQEPKKLRDAASRPVALRDLRALPRQLLQARRSALGHAFRSGSAEPGADGASGLVRAASGDGIQREQAGRPHRPQPSLCARGGQDDRWAREPGRQSRRRLHQ